MPFGVLNPEFDKLNGQLIFRFYNQDDGDAFIRAIEKYVRDNRVAKRIEPKANVTAAVTMHESASITKLIGDGIEQKSVSRVMSYESRGFARDMSR